MTEPVLHPQAYRLSTPDKAAIIFADGGRRSYLDLDEASCRIARLFAARGLHTGDHLAVLMTNRVEWFDVVWAAMRSGIYVTPINFHLNAAEAGYILTDCGARAVVASADLAATVLTLASAVESIPVRLSVGGELPGFHALQEAARPYSAQPPADQREGSWMFYSSGTTGRPKGIEPGLTDGPLGAPTPFTSLLSLLYGFTADSVYLSPSPLYHAAPAGWTTGAQRLGATVVAMERFEPVELLRLIESYRVTHLNLVPTHLIRLLKLPEQVRNGYDLSSLKFVVHSAAPCPVPVKQAAMQWLGPILYEFYAGSEGICFCAIGPQEWLAHPGSVGRSLQGAVHIVAEDGSELPVGAQGQVWFETAHRFTYHQDRASTAAAFNEQGWSSLGDIGRLDEDGFLYLTDRATNMIISGGVNIYPREAEDVLVSHHAVADVAVIGVADEDLGERACAFVQLSDPTLATPELAHELIAFCRAELSTFKCPREVRFVPALPRQPNGKLLKRLIDAHA